MTMTWMRAPDQTWSGATVSFLAMWTAMMALMMLPALVPMIARYRRAVANTSAMRLAALTAIVAAGYFAIWTAVGAAVFPAGAAIAAMAMRDPSISRAVPIVAGVIIVLAGGFQLTAWKTRRLVCCHEAPRHGAIAADAPSAWRHGLRIGLRCVACCANLMAILLVVGVMDIGAMVVVTAVISAERLTFRVVRGPEVAAAV
jgi:predicted metal-binding membrane protein